MGPYQILSTKAEWLGRVCCGALQFLTHSAPKLPGCLGSLDGTLTGPMLPTKALWLFGVTEGVLPGAEQHAKATWLGGNHHAGH